MGEGEKARGTQRGDCVLPNLSPIFVAKNLHPSFCRIFFLTHLSAENTELPDGLNVLFIIIAPLNEVTFPITSYISFNQKK